MASDPLSDVLRSVRLRGSVYYYVSFRDEWVAETPSSRELSAALMPAAEHVLAYHMLLRGSGWAACDGVAPVRLSQGDIVMFPRGDGHVISKAPGMRAPADHSDWRYATRDAPKPVALAYHRGVLGPDAAVPAHEAEAVVICGFIGCDLKPFNPLIDALPPMLHQSASAGLDAWLAPVLDRAVLESQRGRAGSAAVLERVSEMVFVDAARRHLESLPENASGWLGALKDRHVGRAIALMHGQPAREWTVDELGREVGLSKSALHQRFVEQLGQPPMAYLTSWRMLKASSMLRVGDATVAVIAQEVGYQSEAAFTRAFRRHVGEPPAAWRRLQRNSRPPSSS